MKKETMKLRVLTVRMSDMQEVDDRIIDHNKTADRQWLGKHCYWAFRNGHGVQTSPVQE